MTNKEMFAGIIVQVVLDLIFYFAVYNAATIIMKGGLDSFGEVVALIFVAKVVIVHTREWLKGNENTFYKRFVAKTAAMLAALAYWGLASLLIA